MLLGRRLPKSGHFTWLGIFGSGFFAVWITSGSCSMSGHSTDFFVPYTSMLSRYCRAVSKSERMMRALTSVPLNLMCALSTAKGDPYFLTSSLRIVPEPKQLTYSAGLPIRPATGPTQWVAYHIGG